MKRKRSNIDEIIASYHCRGKIFRGNRCKKVPTRRLTEEKTKRAAQTLIGAKLSRLRLK